MFYFANIYNIGKVRVSFKFKKMDDAMEILNIFEAKGIFVDPVGPFTYWLYKNEFYFMASVLFVLSYI